MGFAGFPEAAFDFYDDLEIDNSKVYWDAHKEIYKTAVAGPMTDLVTDLAGEFGEEGGEDILLVSPDEAVAPGGVAPGEEALQRHLALLGGLVHRLDGLEGERDAHGGVALAVGVVLAVPDQFGHVHLDG